MVNSNDEYFNSIVGINNEAEPAQETPKTASQAFDEMGVEARDLIPGLGLVNFLQKNYEELAGAWKRGRAIASTYDERDDVFDLGSAQEALNAPDSLYEAYEEAAASNQQVGSGEDVDAWMASVSKNLKEGENGFMAAVLATREHGVGALAQVSLQSIAQGTNKRVVGEALPITGAGLAGGLAFGGASALATTPAAFMAGTNYAVETIATFDELLAQELKNQNLEFNAENIRAVMSNDESRSRIKRQARQRGVTIGMVEGVTSLAGVKGAGAVTKRVGDIAKLTGKTKKGVQALAGGTVAAASEIAGGSAGEYLGAKAAGMDASMEDIIIEGAAGFGTAPVTATAGAAKVVLSKAKYTLDGESVSKDVLMEYVDGASPQELASMKIEIKNDDITTAEIQEKAITSVIESQLPTNITNTEERAKLVELEKQFRALKGKETVTAEVEKSKIKKQIKDIVSKYEGVEADVTLEETKKEVQDAKLQKNIKFAEEGAKEIGRDSKVFETTEEALIYAMEQGMSEDQANELAGADGFFVGKDNILVVNKEVARQKGAISVGSHELFHGIIGNSFNKLNLKEKSKLVKSFGDVMTKSQRSVVEKRILDNYNENNKYNLDLTKSIFDDSNINKWMESGDETFTVFSDGIELGQIQFDEGVFSKLKNVIQELLRKVGINKEFQNGRQVYNFLKDYNKSVTKGKLSERQKEFAKKDFDMTEIDAKASYTKTDRDKRIDAIGEKSTKAEWDAGGADRAISDMYMSGDLEAIVRNNLSSDLKNLPNYSEEDFISETIGELMPHIKNFNIDRKATQSGFGLSGWIRGQISNKIGNVLKKKKATTETFTVDTTDEKVKETVESTDDLQDLQEEDLSVAAQTKKKAKAERREEKGMEEGVEYSTFRRALKVKGKQGLSDNIVDNVKQAVVKTMATERTTPDSDKFIANIKKSFLTELKKPIQDMMGKKDDFTNFLKTNREAIIAALPTSTLVQMERNVDPANRVFTVEVKRNLNPTETDDAIANNLLPKDTNRTSGPTLYNKRMPSEGEFLRYFSPPLYVPSKKDPNKFVRSGLKGTRKDTLAEQMGIELAFDATMEVVQSPDVAERRSLVTNTDFIDSGVEELARSIGRGVDVKFSRSNPAEVRIKMDLALDNVNTDAYLDIRFSKSSRDAYIKRLVKNRPDLKGQEEQYVDSVFDWLETTDIKKRSKYEKMAMHYMAKGYLILPEDGYKVIEAERLAAIKKIDPFSVGNPNDIIEKYAGTVKGARTNPDTVKEFSNKKDLGNGVVTYDVEQTKEGQLAVREVIDTHFGKKSDPWCLAARSDRAKQAYEEFNNKEEAQRFESELKEQGYDVEIGFIESEGTYEVYGDLMMEPGDPRELDEAFIPWKNYQKGGKGYQIVFTNGKLSHFRDGSGQYWDRMDDNKSYISKKLNDLKLENGFTQKRELNVNTGKEVLLEANKVTGNKQNGTYTDTTIINGETTTKESEFKNGERISFKSTVEGRDGVTTVTRSINNSSDTETTYPKGFDNTGIKYTTIGTIMKKSSKQTGLDLYIKNPTYIRTFEKELDNDGGFTSVTVVKGIVSGKEMSLEVEITNVETPGAPLSSRFEDRTDSIKVNGKTVYTAPKVDDTGIKFSKSKFQITRDGLVATGLGIQDGIIFDSETKTYKLAPEVIDYMRKNTPKPRKNKTKPKTYYPSSEVLGYFKDFYNDLPTSTQLDLSLQGEAIGTEMGRLSKLISGTTEGHLFEAVIARYGYNTLISVQPGITIISKKQAAKKLGTTSSKLPDIVLWDGKNKWESADSLFTVEAKFDNSRAGGVTITDYKFKDFTPSNTKVLNKYDSLDETGEVINETWKQDMLKQFSEPLAIFVKEAEALGTKIVDSKTKVPIGVHNALRKKGNSFLSKVRAISKVEADQIVNYYNNGKFKPVKSDVIAHTSKGAFTLGVDPHGLYANGILPKLAGDYQVTMRLKTNVSKDKTFVTYTPILEIEFRSSDIKGEYADGRKVDASDLKLQNKKDFEKVLENVKGFKLSKSQSTSKAMELGQLTNKDTEAIGMSTFDFDETLIIDGENFITATKGDDVVKITSSQWPLVGDTYASEGYTFDFSDFVNVRGGVDGPLLQKMKNQISKYGVKNVFVLTARPAESATAIQGWLESKGINIPLENITGLGNSSGDAKAQWMLDKFAEGYNDMYFVDDALPNVEAVKNVLDQLDIKGKSVQARVQFSKSIASTLSKNKSYNKFKDSLAESVFYHGGLNSLKNKNAVWFIVDDVNGAELYADVRDVKDEVYSVKASQLKNSIIIPDINDSFGFDKVIKQKFPDQYETLVNSDGQVTIEKVLEVDNAAEIISEYMNWADNKFELFEGVYGPEKGLYDSAGKIAKTLPVIVLNTDVSGKAKQVKPSAKFSKNSLRKNKAVQNVLDQLDIKSKVQQAKIKFSKTASQKLNDMIERKKGIDSDEIISSAAARRRGENINKFQIFVPPTAEDFSGLLYYFAGKGKQGDADLAFMKEFLLDPLSRGERDIAIKKQSLIRGYNELKNNNKEAAAKIKEMAADTPYTKGTAVRVYLWNQDKTDIPGLSDKEVQELVDIVKNDPDLIAYADGLRALVGDSEGKYIAPSNDWVVETIAKDLQDATSRVGRKKFLAEFIENADAFFSKDNLNKMEAAYGKDFRESLEDMLYRIKTGQNRPSGTDASTKKWMNWLNNSVGAIMFFNTKSAVLQLMSTVNYLNWSDNNFLLAGKAFANQKQFWSDFSMLWNSDFLKQRRFGLSTDINEAEIASAAAGAKNKATAVLAYLLKKGFLPTQIADSFAISSGGAAFYRNRVNSYVKQGMDQKAAEEKAMTDFREITEENQQSSRPDRISKQQASPLGRVILAFQNTPMQYARIIKKSVADIVAGRGDLKTHVSKIIFYGGVQSIIFGAMQNALFALAFDDEEDDKKLTKTELEKKQKKRDTQYERTLNTMLDSLLNGSGLTGRVISTIKNVIFKFLDEKDKGWNSDMSNVAIEAANISPPLGSKLRKMKKAGDVYDWNQKVIDEMDTFDINNPIWEAGANVIESTTNVPAARAIKKLESIREAFNQNNETWQRIAVVMGWSQWDLGIEGLKRQAVQETKEELKQRKKDEKAKSKKPTTKKSSSQDAYFNKVVKSRKNEASKVQGGKYRCTALTQDLSQCKNRTDNSSKKCFLHN